MKQTFIPLGEGLTDLYEFKTLIQYNHERIAHIIYFHTPQSTNQRSSVAIVMKPVENKFQAMYIMLNAINYPYPESNHKADLIASYYEPYQLSVKGIDVRPPEDFPELDLYFNYLKSVLRTQLWIPPLS